jgi:hypothetical protein
VNCLLRRPKVSFGNEMNKTLLVNIKVYTVFQVIMDAVELTDSQLKRFKQVFTRSVPDKTAVIWNFKVSA